MVLTREKKKIRPIRIANDVFSRVRKMIRPVRSHRGVLVSSFSCRKEKLSGIVSSHIALVMWSYLQMFKGLLYIERFHSRGQ